MYKPAFWLLFFLLHAAPALAQDEDELPDTVVTVVQPAGPGDTATFDRIQEQLPVAVRTVPQRIVDSLKATDEFWYANAAPVKKKVKKPGATGLSIFQKQWFRTLLWVIILSSFTGVVIWYLVASKIFVFRKSARQIGGDEGLEETNDDIFSRNYDKEISEATGAGDYRLAVRLWYLQTLKILSEKGLIDYRFGRTNQDYVHQLFRHPNYRDFFRLTRNFEYTWYGQFNLSAEAYERISNDFVQFQNSLR